MTGPNGLIRGLWDLTNRYRVAQRNLEALERMQVERIASQSASSSVVHQSAHGVSRIMVLPVILMRRR